MTAEPSTARELFDGVPYEPGAAKNDPILVADNVRRAFGGLVAVDVEHLEVQRGAITALIGPNGAGKTTLFRMITGGESPDNGTFAVGDTVKLGYVDQSRDDLDDSKTVWEVISDGLDEVELGKRTMPSRAYVGQFNFKGGDQQKRVGQLSGGERNRVHLARMLKSGANLLLLDEPTEGLQPSMIEQIRQAVTALRDRGVAILLVEQRVDAVLSIADRVVFLENGRSHDPVSAAALRDDPDLLHRFVGV